MGPRGLKFHSCLCRASITYLTIKLTLTKDLYVLCSLTDERLQWLNVIVKSRERKGAVAKERVEVGEKSKKNSKNWDGDMRKVGHKQKSGWKKTATKVRSQQEWRGKRMGHGRAGSSGLSWRFPKHRPRNAGYFWIQHCDSLLHGMLLNTTAEGLMETYEYVRTKTRLLIYHHHLKIAQAAKNKPWMLPLMPIFKRQQTFSRIHKNILAVRILFSLQFDCQMWPLWE